MAPIKNDPRPKLKAEISAATIDIARLEECIRKEWAEIKDFVHSFEKTDDAQKRIENMKSEIKTLVNKRAKAQAKINHFTSPSWAK